LVADGPIAVTDGDAVEIASVDLADFFGRVSVGNLGGGGLDEGAVPANCAIPASKEPRVRVLLKKNNIASTLSRR
jgi:hypothetical protein